MKTKIFAEQQELRDEVELKKNEVSGLLDFVAHHEDCTLVVARIIAEHLVGVQARIAELEHQIARFDV